MAVADDGAELRSAVRALSDASSSRTAMRISSRPDPDEIVVPAPARWMASPINC
jgi:hypothetical protein